MAMNDADIQRYLHHEDDGMRIQAFFCLMERLKTENSFAGMKLLLALFFDAAGSSSLFVAEAACRWCSALARSDAVAILPDCFRERDAILIEIYSRIADAVYPRYLIQYAFELVEFTNSPDVNDYLNEASFYRVFCRFYSLVPDAMEKLAPLYVKNMKDLMQLVHYEGASPSLVDLLLGQGLKMATNKQAFIELAEKKLGAKCYSFLDDPELTNNVDMSRFWLGTIHNLTPDRVIPKPSNPAAIMMKVGRLLATGSFEIVNILVKSGILEPSSVLLVPLYSVITSLSSLHLKFKSDLHVPVIDELRKLFDKSSNLATTYIGEPTFETAGEWYFWIIRNKASDLLRQWRFIKTQNETQLNTMEAILFLFGLFPILKTEEEYDDFFEILNRSCSPTYELHIVNFHLCYSKLPLKYQLKVRLMKSLASLKVNDILTKQIFSFLFMLHKTEFVQAAYEAVGIMFDRHEWLFHDPNFGTMIKILREAETVERCNAKFSLLKKVCKTDFAEKLVPEVMEWIRDRPEFLVHSIECAANLGLNEVLDVGRAMKNIKQQAMNRNQAEPLVSFCHFLTGSVIDPEELVRRRRNFEKLKRVKVVAISCATELWALRNYRDPRVAKAAYEGLAKFSAEHLLETMVAPPENTTASPSFLSGDQVFDGITNATSPSILEGFALFLHRTVHLDLHHIPRTFFASAQRSQPPPRTPNHLPARSVFRTVLSKLSDPTISETLRKVLLESLINQRRVYSEKVSYCLPPFEWSLFYRDNDDVAAKQCLFTIAIEQADAGLIDKFLASSEAAQSESLIHPKYEEFIAAALPELCQKLPVPTVDACFKFVMNPTNRKTWITKDGTLVKQITAMAGQHKFVHEAICALFPDSETSAVMNDDFFRRFSHIPGVGDTCKSPVMRFWKELSKGTSLNFTALSAILSPLEQEVRDECVITGTSWLRAFVFDDEQVSLLQRLGHVLADEEIDPVVAFELFVAFVSARIDVALPLELPGEPAGEQKRILLESLPERLRRFSDCITASQILIDVLSKEGIFDHIDKQLSLRCLRVVMNHCPTEFGSIPMNLMSLMHE